MTGGDSDSGPIPLRPRRNCPICGKPATRDAYPFCSRRCADIDLGKWLSGRYVIPGAQEDDAAATEDSGDGQD